MTEGMRKEGRTRRCHRKIVIFFIGATMEYVQMGNQAIKGILSICYYTGDMRHGKVFANPPSKTGHFPANLEFKVEVLYYLWEKDPWP